jgi:hypothetical protein
MHKQLPPSRELALRKGLGTGPRLHMQKEIRVAGGSITTGERDRNRVMKVLELREAVELYSAELGRISKSSLPD